MFGEWINDLPTLASEFRTAEPFPVVVIDGFLSDDDADLLLEEFPSPEDMPRSRDYMFGEKRELSSVERTGTQSRKFYEAVMGQQFKSAISEIAGKDLFVDPAFHGGGFHQSGDGGYLDTHVDFNVHPQHPDWLRTLNILLYLNKDWKPEYDGRLLIRTDPAQEPRGIEPLFNRGVLMLTNDHTYHGFDKMSLPQGVTRKSIATYAYQQIPIGSVRSRTTGWAPAEGSVVKRAVARHYDTMVRVKTKVFGSGTAKNR